MSTQRITITMNTNRIERLSWIEHRKRHDGDYDLVGMGRTIETDSKTGIVVSDKTEPTGTTGWLPKEFIDPPKKSLWDVVYEALFSPTPPPIKILHLQLFQPPCNLHLSAEIGGIG